MTTFHAGADYVWRKIRARTSKTRTISAAIAYLSKANILPFKKGDLVVTDLSLQSVRAGITNPKAAITLAGKGVDIRSHPNLHAKVIMVGEHLFVGSMNASASSADDLVEGAIETADKRTHRKAGKWLQKLRDDLKRLTIPELEKLAKEYRPPQGGKKKRQKAPKTSNDDTREVKTWLLHSEEYTEGSKEADQILKDGPEEERLAGYTRDWVNYAPSLHGNIKPGHFIVSTFTEGNRTDVWPPAEVWKNQIIDGRRYLFIAYARGEYSRDIPWQKFTDLASKHKLKKPSFDRDHMIPRSAAQLIEENWPRKRRKRRRKAT